MSLPALPSSDLGAWTLVLAAVALSCGVVALAFEVHRHPKRARLLATGTLAALAVGAALLRPRVSTLSDAERRVPLTVIVDDTRSIDLPFDTRIAERKQAIASIAALSEGHPVRWFAMRGASLTAFDPRAPEELSARGASTDLAAMFSSLRNLRDTEPHALVLVTDGRSTGPQSIASSDILAWRRALPFPGVPVHTVALGQSAPDASLASVHVVGSAFAHGPVTVRIEVLCQGLACDAIELQWQNIPEDGDSPPAATKAVVNASSGHGEVDLTVVYERPGRHAAAVSLVAPDGDAVAENNARTVILDVRRERVRMLHVAGRPTNDVRALRRFLKANPSIDLVSFFILRTPDDDPRAPPSELSLIPFPVDELFEEHLPSFDAVVLQDIDAEEYGLARHLRRLARYVESGGGLVLVGGPHAFAAGGYDRSSLAPVLPTELEAPRAQLLAPFEPREAPGAALHPIEQAFVRGGGKLRTFEGTSALGAPLGGARVLWEHPTETTRTGKAMPVLAIRDVHGGRTVALGTDASWRLGFSEEAAAASGGAYDAFWDALIGWTLHDARFAPPPLMPIDGCAVGERLRVSLPLGGADRAEETLAGGTKTNLPMRVVDNAVDLAPFAAGVHDLTLRKGELITAQGRIVCEAVGDEWIDVRPDRETLKVIAEASGGHAYASPSELDARIVPTRKLPASSRHEKPMAPSWLLALVAATALGVHWFERRRFGLR